jgi:hypothetical protein
VLTDCLPHFSPLDQEGQTIGFIVTRSSRKIFGTFRSKNLDYFPTNPSRGKQFGDFSPLSKVYQNLVLFILLSGGPQELHKSQFKAALRKYLNRNSFYSIDEFVVYKYDL